MTDTERILAAIESLSSELSILRLAYGDMVPQLESIKDRLEAIEHRLCIGVGTV